MNIYYWTFHEWDMCSHHLAIAEDVEAARQMVVEQIRLEWKDTGFVSSEVDDFLKNPKWKVNEFECTVGCLI